MINSGSHFGKVLVPFPVPVPDVDYLAQFFNIRLEAALFPRKMACNVFFFDFCIPFYVGSGSKSSSA
jgi:hypothetical protein